MDIRLLGNVEIHGDTGVLRPRRSSERCVLAVLALHAQAPVRVTTLVDHLWSGTDQSDKSIDTVGSYLRRIRAALKQAGGHSGWLRYDRSARSCVLDIDPAWVDYHRFTNLTTVARRDNDPLALREALALWRGPALADIGGHWADHRRHALQAERLAVYDELLTAYLRSGRHADVVRITAELVDEVTPTDRLLLLGAQALAGSDRHTAIPGWVRHVTTRMRQTADAAPAPNVLDEIDQITAHLTRGRPSDSDPSASAQEPPAHRRDGVPRQLPAAPRYFVGRADELAELTKALDNETGTAGTVLISALAGAGGIGKTALALHWAHANLHRFPDGQLFVDLQGFSPAGAPVRPAAAVRGFLEALGVDSGRIPAGLAAQAALYRSLVAGKRMLIVLDNGADAAQEVPLLPGCATCTVIVTSRRHLTSLITRHGARHVRLGVLPDDDARHLLSARIGAERIMAEPAAVADLLACCGGYPLALDIVAARVALRPRTSLAELATDLLGSTTRLDTLDDEDPAASLPAVLSWSYRALTAEQRTVFGLLGIAPGPDIGLPAVASLTGVAAQQVRAVLLALEDASMLDRHPAGRYSMHDLIRAYASNTAHHDLTENTRQAALRRIIDFYTHTAHTADRLLDPHRPPIQLDPPAPGTHPHPLSDTTAAMAWFDTEHRTLLAAQHTAASHAWHATVWHLAWALATYHRWQGHRNDELAVWRATLDAAIYLPDPTSSVSVHRNLGFAFAELGRHEEATEHLHQALALAERHHDPAQQAFTHQILTRVWEMRGDDRRALSHASHALDLFRALGQPAWEADALNQMGWHAARLGDHDTARADCQAALTLYRRHNDPDGEAATLDSLGYIDHRTGHHEQAIDHHQQAITLFRDRGNTYSCADILERLGHPHAALGQHDHARTVWQEALALYQEQGRDEDAARVRGQLDDLGAPDSI